jgi:hypothetical protein
VTGVASKSARMSSSIEMFRRDGWRNGSRSWKRPRHGPDDRKNGPCPLHLDRTFADARSNRLDRWPIELAQKHGMRDGYVCPVGGRWAVGYWSPGVLGNDFTQQARGLLRWPPMRRLSSGKNSWS